MEFVWRPYAESLGTNTQILTHVLYDHYSSPEGLGFDMLDNEERRKPWINNKESRNFNAESKGNKFAVYLSERASHYLTDELFVLFGDDFHYMNAQENYRSMDNMIAWMN